MSHVVIYTSTSTPCAGPNPGCLPTAAPHVVCMLQRTTITTYYTGAHTCVVELARKYTEPAFGPASVVHCLKPRIVAISAHACNVESMDSLKSVPLHLARMQCTLTFHSGRPQHGESTRRAASDLTMDLGSSSASELMLRGLEHLAECHWQQLPPRVLLALARCHVQD